jgi:hypothetical protein
MSHNWWTRKSLVIAAGIVALACALSLAVFGLSTPEPVASAALGPDWYCSRLIFVFTTCSRIKHTQATPARIAKIRMCGRLRT